MSESETSNLNSESKLTLTVDEAARALGVSRTTIYRLIASRQLHVPRALRKKLIPTAELQRFLNECT